MKKYLIILFLGAFVIPSVTLASWWNPSSWFKKPTSVTQPAGLVQPVVSSPTTSSQNLLDQQTTKSQTTKKSVLPKPVPKKVITSTSVNTQPSIIIPIQKVFPQGCTSTMGFSSTTGASCQTTTATNQNITPFTTSYLQTPQQDSALKVAQCQAKRDSDNSKFIAQANTMLEKGIEESQKQEQDAIANTYPPSQVGWEAYQINVNIIKNYYNSLREQTKQKVAPILDQGKAAIDSDYLKCVNQ